MSDVIVTVVESTTDVTVTEPTVLVDVTENSVEVLSSTAGIQGAKGNDGGLGFYGAFADYTDQFAGGGTSYANSTANVAYPMRFTTTDESHGVSVVDGDGFQSRITFAYSGVYNLQWSGQFENIDNALHDVSVWLRKGGVDNVVGSNGLVGIPARKTANEPAHIIAGWNFVFSVMAGDYYEFMWSSDSTNVSIQTYPVSVVPTRPSTASLVLTVTQVMNNALPSGTLAVVSPITNSGTSANAVLGLDQTALSITQSQVSGLVSALAGKANLAGGNSFTGSQTIATGATEIIGLQVNAFTGQTADLGQFRDASSTLVTKINSAGLLSTTRNITINGSNAGEIGMIVRGATSQTARLQEWRNSGGTILAGVTNGGAIATTNYIQNVAGNTPYLDFTQANSMIAQTRAATYVGLIIKGAASQTANLQEWQNSAGTILARITSAGTLRASQVLSLNGLSSMGEFNNGAIFEFVRATAQSYSPGANRATLYFRDGTNVGTLKLVVRAGAAGAETTILDNIPQ